MSTQILRPTPPGDDKRDKPWRLTGSWGNRDLPPSSRIEFYGCLFNELLVSGLLPGDSTRPSNRHHFHVTSVIMNSSWDGRRWVRDVQR